ncbi:unnamed protein product [Zymoseptoria tritici ST99CH_3D1]|nr:unnamed protein product [Zymoseptoria tritici ST99CH_3D1]
MSTSPPLRIAGGTLRIALSPNHEDDLILDRELVMTRCFAFAPLLRAPHEPGYCAAWDKSILVKVPSEDEPVRVYTLALRVIDGTMLLEGSDYHQGDDLHEFKNFHNSVYTTSNWPCAGFSQNAFEGVEEAAIQHCIMFDILHGIKIAPERLHIPYGQDAHDAVGWSGAFGRICEMCARAEFYGCLPFVASAMKEIISQAPSLWEAIAYNPRDWHQLAIKLRWEDVYFDSLRHIVAHTRLPVDGITGDPSDDFYVLGLTPTEFQDFASELQAKQAIVLLTLQRSLHHLQLCGSYSEYNKERFPTWITFLNLFKNAWPGRSAHVKTMEKCEFLACAIFGQWLAEQESGDHVWISTRRKADRSGPLQNGLMKLEEATNSTYPPSLFGRNVPRTISSIFLLDRRFEPGRKIDAVLTEIVREADKMVKFAFETYEEEQGGKTLTWRRSRFDGMARGDYGVKVEAFTFLPLDEKNVPWAEEKDWATAEAVVPITVEVAAEAYVAAIQGA